MKITIIGAGNIGGAIARGLVRGGVFNASDITCTDLMQANLDRLLSADACFNVSQDNPTAIQGADLVVIAVKPWRVEAVIDEIRGALDYERQSVVSVAAGIPSSGYCVILRKMQLQGIYHVVSMYQLQFNSNSSPI